VHTTPTCVDDCPTSFDAIVAGAGAACPDSNVACSYDEGTCGCVGDGASAPGGEAGTSSFADGGDGEAPKMPGVWKCVAPPTTVPCPSARPRVLDACVKPVSCDYGTCELQRPMGYACTAGYWEKYVSVTCDP
jgi:hypothetical protein